MSDSLEVSNVSHFLKLVGVGIIAGVVMVLFNAYVTAPAERAVGLAA